MTELDHEDRLSRGPDPSQALRWFATVTVLLLLALLFWKLRVLAAPDPRLGLGSFDLYLEHYPMVKYGFGALREGQLPLWNPYQLFGQPFLAIYYVGLLYPLNLIYLLPDTGLATEASFLIHTMIGATGMVALVRRAGMSFTAALIGALTFIWSGLLIYAHINQPSLFGSTCWIPLLLFLSDRVLGGSRRAWLWLMLGVGTRLLLGGMEIFLHTSYAIGILAMLRMAEISRERPFAEALRRLGLVAVAVAGGVLLASPQLFPSIELMLSSGRGAGLTYEQAVHGQVSLLELLDAAPAMAGVAGVGVLLLAALPLALVGRGRSLGILGVALVVVAVLHVSGGLLYRIYFELPFVGGLFRRPTKFMDLYSVGAALATACIVQRLFDWRGLQRSRLWQRGAWWASMAMGAGVAIWGSWRGAPPLALLAALALFVAYGVSARHRTPVVVMLCVLQVAACFFSVRNRTLRPFQQPEVFNKAIHQLLRVLPPEFDEGRVYVSGVFSLDPSLAPKQGMLNEIPFAVDYTPLAPGRTARFFETVTGGVFPPDAPFDGRYGLDGDSRWDLLDLTSTRFYAVGHREPVKAFMDRESTEFRRASPFQRVALYERSRAFPRAYFVPSGHVVSDGEEALATLEGGSLDLRSTVVLEVPPGTPMPPTLAGNTSWTATPAKLARAEPELVEVEVHAPVAGFLVLTDTYYPGWSARTLERELPLYRANYLFRAVPLGPGVHRVTFEYRPGSIRWGLGVSGVTALVAIAGLVRGRRPSLRH